MKRLFIALLLLAPLAHAGELEEARAALYERWGGERYLIQSITKGYLCGVITAHDARLATQDIEYHMNEELAWAGGKALNLLPEDSIKQAMLSAIVAVNNGACARMTPGDKGRLRNFINQ